MCIGSVTTAYSIHTAPGKDFNISSLTQTGEFTPSDSVGAVKCISVRIIDDDIADPDEMFRVEVTASPNRVTVSR